MRTSQYFSLLVVLVGMVVSGCVPEKGPVLVNRSGGDLAFTILFEDGTRKEGLLTKEMVLWLGYDQSPIATVRLEKDRSMWRSLSRSEVVDLRKSITTLPLVLLIEVDSVRAVSRAELRSIRESSR